MRQVGHLQEFYRVARSTKHKNPLRGLVAVHFHWYRGKAFLTYYTVFLCKAFSYYKGSLSNPLDFKCITSHRLTVHHTEHKINDLMIYVTVSTLGRLSLYHYVHWWLNCSPVVIEGHTVSHVYRENDWDLNMKMYKDFFIKIQLMHSL